MAESCLKLRVSRGLSQCGYYDHTDAHRGIFANILTATQEVAWGFPLSRAPAEIMSKKTSDRIREKRINHQFEHIRRNIFIREVSLNY